MPNIDTYDEVDMLIRNNGLSELDKLLKADEDILATMPKDDELYPFWFVRTANVREALHLSEYCVMNNIPTCDIPPEAKPDRHRMTFVLSAIKALEEETRAELAFIRKRLNESKEKTYYTNKKVTNIYTPYIED
ncbi:hypothetical protein LCGC14_1380050 [marine sediment metagenome]|uniref:Uncharacterized protein n=1 Tax=marine sediment metagenome TaxID=412755 RepID=A0A0F9K314_9ZZZZ